MRKLGPEDRLAGAIKSALENNLPYDKILFALVCGCHFKAKDEEGNIFKPDFDFIESLSKEFEMTLIKNLGFDPVANYFIIKELKRLYMINHSQQ
jgi:hypothetical protein